MEISVRKNPVHVTKLPSIPIINNLQTITDDMVNKYKNELESLIVEERVLHQLLEKQKRRGYVLKGRYGGCAVNVYVMKEDEFTQRKMELILRECPHYDFFLEPYLECMKALEHCVFLSGDSQSWLVDTYTSTSGVVRPSPPFSLFGYF